MIRPLFFFLLAPLALPVDARVAPADTTSAKEHHALFATTMDAWADNPALRFDGFQTSYGQLSLYAGKQWQPEAVVLQEGNALWNVGVEASSYRRLGESVVVWGQASYQQGKRLGVEWNASSDWRTVYPYVLADTLGGDRSTERYTFQGGCATRLGAWTIGEELAFRAEHEWGTTDPRPRGVVTDLKARVAVSRLLLGHHLALGGTLKLYKQTNSVEFYREEGAIPEYQMSGLGTWYERFSGTNCNTYYQATGWGCDLAVRPGAKQGVANGLLLSALYEKTPYRRVLSSLNALPLQRLYVTRWQARLGWQMAFGRADRATRLALWGSMGAEKRQGDEIIGGQSTADEYAERGRLTMYRNRLHDQHVALLASVPLSAQHTLSAHVRVGQQDYTSSYAFPHRAMDFCKDYVEASLQWQAGGPRWHLDTDVAVAHHRNKSGTLQLSGDTTYTSPLTPDVASAAAAMTARATASAQASYTQWTLRVRGQWQPRCMGSFALFCDLSASLLSRTDPEAVAATALPDRSDKRQGYRLCAAVGINF